MSAISVQSFAKINLFLAVQDVQSSGFHDIETVFHSVGLADDLTVSVADSPSSKSANPPIKLRLRESSDPTLADELPTGPDNIAHAAAQTYMARNSEARSMLAGRQINVELTKTIPMGAGLAGGSSNAAAVLGALEHLMTQLGGAVLGEAAVLELCAELGSDVPFCYMGGCMEGAGRGERLSVLPALPDCHIVVMVPEVSISTAAAYGWLDETRESGELGVSRAPGDGVEIMRDALASQDLGMICASLHNDFEHVVFPRYPVVAELRDMAVRSGAIGALLSGSGSAVFAICDNIEGAHQISAEVEGSRSGATSFVVGPSDCGWSRI